jgi:hypothetical protein
MSRRVIWSGLVIGGGSGLNLCISAAQQGPIRSGEPDLPSAHVAFQNRDLVAEDQDLGVLVPIARRKKTQDCERASPSSRPIATAHSRIMP